MQPREYWRKRSAEIEEQQHEKAEEYIERLKKEYERAIQSIQRDIEAFYERYAINNEISMAEARKLLSKSELKNFRITLEEFVEKAKDNVDGRWTRELNNIYYRSRISRLEALLTQTRQQIEILTGDLQEGTKNLLSDTYTDTYYRTLYEIQKGTGIGVSFARVDKESLNKVLQTKWLGENYSERIWRNRDKLITELQTRLSQAFIRGDSVERTSKVLAERMEVSFSNAARIVRTESSFIVHQATWDSYKASEVVEKYEYLATLDDRTSEICRSMDGKVFKLSEKEVGVNYPPLHPNCRSTVVPYFDDEEDVGKRIARHNDGETYYVPADMTYEHWYDKYVTQATRKEYESILLEQVTIDNLRINKISDHCIDRAITRKVKAKDVLDALRNPLKIAKIKTDGKGRRSKKYIGEKATASINPDTGILIQVNPTSSKYAKRLKRQKGE